jgi:hypothetical protein
MNKTNNTGESMDPSENRLRRKAVRKARMGVLFEVLRWGLVLWLLYPLAGFMHGRISVTRVVAGICLFVVFAGKLFHDVLFADFIRQRRTSMRQDLFALAGMILAILFLAGLVVAMVAVLMRQWQDSIATPEPEIP